MTSCPWPLADEDYEFIKGEAVNLLNKLNIRHFPIVGAEIAIKDNIHLIPYSHLSALKRQVSESFSDDGYCMEINDEEYIFYNDAKSIERQNWTILHELGHINLDHTGSIHSEKEEAEADFFAKYLIAPPILVCRLKARNPSDVSKHFLITPQASVYAYNYSQKWLEHYRKTNQITAYEEKLLDLYETKSMVS